MSEITLPLAATSAEHAPKSIRQNVPIKAVEKKDETYVKLKRNSSRIFTFRQP